MDKAINFTQHMELVLAERVKTQYGYSLEKKYKSIPK